MLADGFYEWSGEGAATRIDTFAIVTTAANELLQSLHPRMPVILAGADLDAWLDPASEPARVTSALAGVPTATLRYIPVSKRVNSARVDEANLIEPTGSETVVA